MNDARSHSLPPAAMAYILVPLTMLSACQQPAAQNNLSNAIEEPVPQLAAEPAPRSLDRAAILAAVARAASAKGSGADDSEVQRALDGRQLEFRIRFGCKGPSSRLRDEWLGWALDSGSGTLRVRARPTLDSGDELLVALGGDQFEAVEGFWIPRPWLLDAVCPAAERTSAADRPAAASDSTPPAVAGAAEPLPRWPRIGLAQFFTKDDARTRRRSMRPYEAVKTLDAKQPIGAQGFNLVLSGRLTALPSGQVIACAAEGAESSPECVVSADFDRVWIENPATREVVAEWGGG